MFRIAAALSIATALIAACSAQAGLGPGAPAVFALAGAVGALVIVAVVRGASAPPTPSALCADGACTLAVLTALAAPRFTALVTAGPATWEELAPSAPTTVTAALTAITLVALGFVAELNRGLRAHTVRPAGPARSAGTARSARQGE